MTAPATVLAVGGLDPSGGAGIVADARSVAAVGGLPLVLATALTVQAGVGVRGWQAVPVPVLDRQLDCLLERFRPAAVKIGQVPTAACARWLARRLTTLDVAVVLDPVVVASGGGRLADLVHDSPAWRALAARASVVVANLGEAEVLSGIPPRTRASTEHAARTMAQAGAHSVLIKGGHRARDCRDLLWWRGQALWIDHGPRLRIRRAGLHGSGCAHAAALATALASGCDLPTAARRAAEHVRALITDGWAPDRGALLRRDATGAAPVQPQRSGHRGRD
jgi:hydroxymethylpyrimidine kinase/phosphomethylpyrimidine kinase